MFGSGNNPSLVKTAIDKVFYPEFDYEDEPGIANAKNSVLFMQDTTQLAAVITEEYSGVGEWESHDEEEERKLTTVRTGNQKTHNVANYKKTVKFPVEFFEDEKFGIVNRVIKDIAMRGRTTQDKKALSIYPDGLSGAATSSDGAALFSNSHTALGSGNTIDNLETGSLTPANLETLIRVLLEQQAQDGDLGGHVAKGLLVPPILFPDALEITKSELKSGTGNNDLNYFSLIYPGMQVFQSPYVGAAYNSYANANTSHYLVSRNHSITRIVRKGITTQLVSPDTDDQDRYTYKARYREVTSVISWEGLVASNGTT